MLLHMRRTWIWLRAHVTCSETDARLRSSSATLALAAARLASSFALTLSLSVS